MRAAAPNFVATGEACRILKVTPQTLTRWANQGKIKCFRPNGERGHRRYDLNTFQASDQTDKGRQEADAKAEREHAPAKVDAIYARVSTRKQKADLERQVKALKDKHPDHVVFTDIASGLNFKRKGLKALLQCAFEGRLRKVRIAHKDRLCRFAYDLLEHVLAQHGAEIAVDQRDEDTSAERELADDVLAVITVFGARLYGRRSAGKGAKALHARQDQAAAKAEETPEEGQRPASRSD